MNRRDRDTLIRTALTPAEDTAVPAGLAEDIHARIVATPQRPAGLAGWLSRPAAGQARGSGLGWSTAATVLLLALLLIATILAVAQRLTPVLPTDVLTYHGNSAQTGVMPGPGPAGEPVIDWQASLPGPMGSLNMPIVHEAAVYLADQRGTLSVLDEDSGAKLWEAGDLVGIAGTPVAADGLVIVGTEEGSVVAFDPATRQPRWRSSIGTTIDASLASLDGVVLAGGADGLIHRLSARDGAKIDAIEVGGPILRSPAIAGGVVYAVADGGLVVAFDAATGANRWRVDLGSGEVATPAVSSGFVYVTHGVDGSGQPYELLALDVRDGAVVWRWLAPTSARLFVGAVADDGVYAVSEDRSVYRLDGATGEGRAWYTADDAIGSLASVVGDTLYVASADGTVHALDRETGGRRWAIAVEGAPTMPVVVNGRVIVATSLGQVVALGSR
jgi:outer membrane protein assembly factor BamB